MFNEFLERLFQRSKDKNSRSEVKRRLKLILAHDRADLSPAIVESMQQEILEVISRYVELDTEGLSFALESDRHTTALTANFPILRVKDDTEEDSPDRLESQDDQTTQEEDLRVAAIENLEIVVEENEDAEVSATTKNPE